ncbi:MAG: MarR family transcriptional regulator [Bacteroidaceae bacterium]
MDLLDLDIRLIFAILNGKVSAAINRKLNQNFHSSGFDLTPEKWTVLLYLGEQDGVTQQHLCTATFKDKPSMTRLIDVMEKQGIVKRMPNKLDRRTNQVYITKLGREVRERAQVVAIRTLKEALSGLGINELRISQEVLRKVFSNTTVHDETLLQKPKNRNLR